jgi:sigma-B regulation protein RsbU (phosphoserine phosphatase)
MGRKLNILIVDDEKEQRIKISRIIDEITIAHTLLAESKPEIFPAGGGKGAFDVLNSQRQKIDLILLDINLQGENGFDLCKKIKEDESFKTIPVIFITGSTEPDKIEMCYKSGGIDYIYKGSCIEEQVSRIKTALISKLDLELIQQQKQHITDSIDYSKRIQHAILPDYQNIKEKFPESFIVYKPKDIVAGDFYWFQTTDTHIFVAACDCTGHGVPGAMLSVFCSNILSRALIDCNSCEPSQILQKFYALLEAAFSKKNPAETIQDEMDITLCMFTRDLNNLTIASINQKFWFFRNKENLDTKQVITKRQNNSFNSKGIIQKEYTLKPGDTIIYLSSDGLMDQFGGANDEKLKSKGVLEFLSGIQKFSMEEQRILIDEFIESWKGNTEQTDDILIIGIKV